MFLYGKDTYNIRFRFPTYNINPYIPNSCLWKVLSLGSVIVMISTDN